MHRVGVTTRIRHPGGKDGWYLIVCGDPDCDYSATEAIAERAANRVVQHAQDKNRAAHANGVGQSDVPEIRGDGMDNR